MPKRKAKDDDDDDDDDEVPEPINNLCRCDQRGNSNNFKASGGPGCNSTCCKQAYAQDDTLCQQGPNCVFSINTSAYCPIP